MVMLEVKDIYKSYGDVQILKGVSFTMEKEETKVIIGPSGTGKSTLLRCINQLRTSTCLIISLRYETSASG
jgi:ABC-type polar amino acid transport system ATPase subunit